MQKKITARVVGEGQKNLQGPHPLPGVLCFLSYLESPGRKEKIHFSWLPSIRTCEIVGRYRQIPPFNLLRGWQGWL